MEPQLDVMPILIMTGVLLAPALVILTIFIVVRSRRGKFRHQHRRR